MAKKYEKNAFDAKRYRKLRQGINQRSLASAKPAFFKHRKFLHHFADGRVIGREYLLDYSEIKYYQGSKKKLDGSGSVIGRILALNKIYRILLVYIIISAVLAAGMATYFVGRFAYVYLTHKNYDKTNLSIVLKQPSKVAVGSDGMIASQNGDYYVFHGMAENNYVWYSGNMYRIMKVTFEGEITLISDDPISAFVYRSGKQSFVESEIYRWLNKTEDGKTLPDGSLDSGVYYNSLYKPEEFLNHESEYCTLSDAEGNCQQKTTAVVGLLSIDQYLEAGAQDSFLNNESDFWTMTPDENGEIYAINAEGGLYAGRSFITSSYGIRPVIQLKANTKFLGGKGSIEEPYFVGDEEYLAIEGESKLNDRYPGEYVLVGDDLFRISKTSANNTKLIQAGVLGGDIPKEMRYSDNNKVSNMFVTSDKTSLAYYLNNNYLHNNEQSDLFVKGTTYIGTYNDDSKYQYNNLFQKEINNAVTLPKIGELYNANVDSDLGYWCLDVYSLNGYMMTSLTINNQVDYVVTTKKRNVKISIFISNKAIINGGNGTLENPYTIK